MKRRKVFQRFKIDQKKYASVNSIRTWNREGFWKTGVGSNLPSPAMTDGWVWWGRDMFLRKLQVIQLVAGNNHCKGSSRCRICGKSNGSIEYFYGGWIWPEGYGHYISEHNVVPSLAFQEFVFNGTIS